jgi:hypothetical protein
MRSDPEADGVKLTEQLEVVALIATRVHGLGVPNVPAAGVLNKTAPPGVVGVPEMSLTKAVQDEA